MNKPEFLDNIQSTAKTKINSLQPREKFLLVGSAIVLVVMIVFTIFHSMNVNINKELAETENYRKALNYIAENQALYQRNKAKKEAMRQKLLSADSKVVSKLTSMASALGFDVTVTPKDPKKTSDDSGTEEQEIEVQLKNVDYNKFLEYLVQIYKLDTPIYMRHINMNRTSNNSGSDTKMTVSITLMSYRLKEQNAT
ncbi:MAG: type II secretion system protein M [Proteobacteria bacterium]|nr:type II secretion system protein M [Pseudomonadota bacterium]